MSARYTGIPVICVESEYNRGTVPPGLVAWFGAGDTRVRTCGRKTCNAQEPCVSQSII